MLQIKVFVRVKTSNDISITEYLHESLKAKQHLCLLHLLFLHNFPSLKLDCFANFYLVM